MSTMKLTTTVSIFFVVSTACTVTGTPFQNRPQNKRNDWKPSEK